MEYANYLICIFMNFNGTLENQMNERSRKNQGVILTKLELMFMKHYAPNRCLYIKVAKLRTGVGSAEMSHLQNRCLKISG